MDLGRARLRKIGLNNLRYAVHPQHGVIWTDGKGIYLAPIHVQGQQVQNAASVKVGEFENVTSVHWSSSSSNAESCHMCVVHQQNVTVWRVSGALPKLIFKQVRKINVRPVPQGCLWNPGNDVLCLLSRHQCSFYYRHDLNKANYAFPALESSSISCGCWSADGTKLILCVGAALLIYRWSDVNAAIEDFSATAWKIPGLEGKLTAITAVLKDSVIVAAEIPLESLFKQQDMFKVPDTLGDSQINGDGIIRPNKSSSMTDSLLNLQTNTQSVTDSRSSLTMIHLPDGSLDPVKLSTVSLKGTLTPDILMYEKCSQCVVVASNSQSQLQIYALLEKYPVYCGNIQLTKDQRPKGVCSMPTLFDDRGAAILILVGQREVMESALIAPSTEADFKLSMKYIILKTGSNHHLRNNGSGDSHKGRASSLVRCERLKPTHETNLSDSGGDQDGQKPHSENSPDDQFKITIPTNGEPFLNSHELLTKPVDEDCVHKTKLIDDLSSPPCSKTDNLEVDTVSFSSQPPSFNNSKLAEEYCLDPVSSITPNGHTDQLDSSTYIDTQSRYPVEDDYEKTNGISDPTMSKEPHYLSTFNEPPKSDMMLKEDDSSESHIPETQKRSNEDTGPNISNSQNLHSEKELSSSLPPEIQPEIIIPFIIKRQSINRLSSLQPEIEHDVIIPSEVKREFHNQFSSLLCETTTVVPHTASPSQLSSLPPEIEHEIIIPMLIKRESRNKFTSLQPEMEPEIIIPFQVKRELPNYFSSSQPEIESEVIIPTENEREFSSQFSNLQSETQPTLTAIIPHTEATSHIQLSSLQSEVEHEIIIPFLIKRESLNHFSNLRPEIEPEIIIPIQTTRESRTQFSCVPPEMTPEIIIPFQNKREPLNHFSSLIPEIEPEIIIPTQITRESSNQFSSLQPEIRHEIIIPSQIKRRSPDHFSRPKPEATAIIPQTETKASSQFSSLQTKTKAPSQFSSLQSETKSEIATTIPQTETNAPSQFSSLPPEIEPEIIVPTQVKRELCSIFFSLKPETKSETSTITPQTETNTPPSKCPGLQQPVTTHETTRVITQTETNIPKNVSYLRPHLSRASPFGAQEESPGRSYRSQSDILANSHEDNRKLSDLRKSLQEQDLDRAKNDSSSDLDYRGSQDSFEAIWDALEKQAKSQKDSIDALHQRLELLSTSVDKTCCVFPTKYQDASHAEMVEISCEKSEGTQTKMFLLDSGRLQLEPIKLAFELATVELWLDGVPCVLGPNIDGYIPLKFSSSSKLQIRGRPMYS